ncbi:MAG: hypothetical protein U0641_04805 [Anaerolineae bacterium]
MRGRRSQHWVDVLVEVAWIGMFLGAAMLCPFPDARHLVEIGVIAWVGWRVIRWLPAGPRRSQVAAPPSPDPIAEINAIVSGLWGNSDKEKTGEE